MAQKQISDLAFASGITKDDEFVLRKVSDGTDYRITREESRSDLASTAQGQGSALVGDASGATVHDLLPIHLQFATYADLRAYSHIQGVDIVQITGDGIAGIFKADPSDTTTADDGGTVIVAADGMRWKRLIGSVLFADWWGAVGDGTTDDTTAIQNAVNASAARQMWCVFTPNANYLTSAVVHFRTGTRLWLYGATITSSGAYETFYNVTTTNDTHDVWLYGGTYDTNATYGTSFTTSYPNPTGIRLAGTSAAGTKAIHDIHIADAWFKNLRIGINLTNQAIDNVKRVGNVYINNIRGENLYAALGQLDGQDVFVDGFLMNGGNYDCFDVHTGNNVNISNGAAYNCAQYGLLIRNRANNGNTETVHVGNMTIDGGRGLLVSDDANAVAGQYVRDLAFDNISIRNTAGDTNAGGFWINVGVSTVSDVQFNNVTVNGSTRTGRAVYMNGPSNQRLARINGRINVVNPAHTAVEAQHVENSQLDVRLTQSGTTQDLILLGYTIHTHLIGVIDGGNYGVNMQSGANCQFSLTINNVASDGILLAGAPNNMLNGCFVSNAGGYGVHTTGTTNGTIITGGYFSGTSGAKLLADTTAYEAGNHYV